MAIIDVFLGEAYPAINQPGTPESPTVTARTGAPRGLGLTTPCPLHGAARAKAPGHLQAGVPSGDTGRADSGLSWRPGGWSWFHLSLSFSIVGGEVYGLHVPPILEVPGLHHEGGGDRRNRGPVALVWRVHSLACPFPPWAPHGGFADLKTTEAGGAFWRRTRGGLGRKECHTLWTRMDSGSPQWPLLAVVGRPEAGLICRQKSLREVTAHSASFQGGNGRQSEARGSCCDQRQHSDTEV